MARLDPQQDAAVISAAPEPAMPQRVNVQDDCQSTASIVVGEMMSRFDCKASALSCTHICGPLSDSL
jgi:hypothetical protein